jgi:trimethylamine--corrinoid protein Co-methyltransferase
MLKPKYDLHPSVVVDELMQGVEGGQLKLLSQDCVDKIHSASLDVLERVGMLFEYDEALAILADVGAEVNHKTKVVKIPRHLVDEAIRKTPRSVTLCGRNPRNDLRLEGREVHVGGPMGAMYVQDLDGERRRASVGDLERITRLEDALENVHVVPTAVAPQEIPPGSLYPKAYETIVNNTEKHVYHDTETIEDLHSLLEMAATVVGGEEELRKRPIISFANCPVSPLTANKRFLQVLMECARRGVPFSIEPDPQMGATSPVTLIGTILQTNAEVLGGLTLAQVISPGTPVIYSHGATVFDLRGPSMGVCWGAPERGLIHVATAQLTQHYGIPSCCIALTTDAKGQDTQAGYEKACTFLMTAMAGVNLIHSGVGTMDSNLTVNFGQLVLDNELVQSAFRILEGISTPEGSLEESLEVIGKVATSRGQYYLSQEHTMKHLKSEHWIPSMMVRGKWGTWEKSGSKDAEDLAREKARRILAEHRSEPLPNEIKDKIRRIVNGAIKNLGSGAPGG